MATVVFSSGYWMKIGIIIAVALTVILEARSGYFSSFKRFSAAGFTGAPLFFYPAVFFAVLFAFFWDANILHFLQSLNDPATALVSGIGRFLGKKMLVVLIGFYLVSAVFRHVSVHRMVRGMLFASALSGLVITVLKFTFMRARPSGGLGPYCFFNLDGTMHGQHVFQSFPSGDVAVVAGAFGYLFYAVKSKYLRLLCVLTVLATALSRIQRNSHWPSDTLAAFAIGFAVSRWITAQEGAGHAKMD